VREAAAASLGRVAGEPVDAGGTASARRASGRRIAERLAAMDGEELRAAVLRSAATVTASTRMSLPLPRGGEGQGEGARAPARAARTAVAVLAQPTPLTPSLSPRSAAGKGEIRISPLPLAGGGEIKISPLPLGGEGQGEGANSELLPQVLAELRSALRGCTEEQLAIALATPRPRIDAALAGLAARGAAERRGTRWFMS
jgi:hypothetical protein